MVSVRTTARAARLTQGTFRLDHRLLFHVDIHDTAATRRGHDGRLSLDGGPIHEFEFLGRGETGTGTSLAFLRIGDPHVIVALRSDFGDMAGLSGGTRLAMRDLSAKLPIELPCLVAGSRIATPGGLRQVERLAPGDLVLGRDRRPVRVLHCIRRRIEPGELASSPDARPVVVLAGGFTPDMPARDVRLSRRQRVLMSGWRADMMRDFGTVLAPAGCIIDGEGVVQDEGSNPAVFVHLILEEEAVVLVEGLPVEAAHPDGHGTRGHRGILASELKLLRPTIHAAALDSLGRPARPPLCGWEVSALERERRCGTWAEALWLSDLPPTPPKQDRPLVLEPTMRVNPPGRRGRERACMAARQQRRSA